MADTPMMCIRHPMKAHHYFDIPFINTNFTQVEDITYE